MTVSSASIAAPSSLGARIIQFPLTRIVLAIVMCIATVAGSMYAIRFAIPDKAMRFMWPFLLTAALCVGAYCLYVRWIEKRSVTEFSRPRALREFGAGAWWGMLLMSLVMGGLALLGVYQVTDSHNWKVLLDPFGELVLVAIMEEVAFRGILFRIIEQSLGTWLALIISSILFSLAHLGNDGANLLAVISVTAAGVLLAGAYMLTRRLWFPIGLHFAWNYCLMAVFSVTVSGHPSNGLLEGKVSGADWLTGGAFGVEASVLTPVIVSIAATYFIVQAWRRGTFVLPFWKLKKIEGKHAEQTETLIAATAQPE
jgi:membrane protease YdiL (CAAX protease family)